VPVEQLIANTQSNMHIEMSDSEDDEPGTHDNLMANNPLD
jgi:hypothetical protein